MEILINRETLSTPLAEETTGDQGYVLVKQSYPIGRHDSAEGFEIYSNSEWDDFMVMAEKMFTEGETVEYEVVRYMNVLLYNMENFTKGLTLKLLSKSERDLITETLGDYYGNPVTGYLQSFFRDLGYITKGQRK